MSNKLRKIAASVMAVAALTTGAMSSLSANASTADTNITNFTAPPSVSGTYNPIPVTQNGVRVKSTDSSIYVKINGSTYNVSVQTWGLPDTKWSGGSNKTLNASGGATNAVTLSAWHRYQIKNRVNESGYPCAGLKMCSSNQYNASTVNGAWSPDYSPENGVILAG